jgi:DNA-binding transcriptional ArsR family regulator
VHKYCVCVTNSPRELTDLEALRALAHPRRLRIRQYLELNGPATSAMLARALGLNTGATSYHLRELAQHGFVEDVPERTHGRERWWRAAEVDLRFLPISRQSTEMRAVFDELNRLSVAADLELFARSQLELHEMGEWADTLRYSRGSIKIAAEDFDAFFEDYIALLNRYDRPADDGPDPTRTPTRTILTRLFTFPAPDPTPDYDSPDGR